jgi:Ca-activated chloride channel homolog
MQMIAQQTGGRFYDAKDPKKLPQIFVKEAQMIQQSLIREEPTELKVADGSHEILRGVGGLPKVDGYIVTAPKEGAVQTPVVSPDGDPILATGHNGLGRCVAFTSAVDSRWGANWLGWGRFNEFWEKTLRWVGKTSQEADCEIYADAEGRTVTIDVEAMEKGGKFAQFQTIQGYAIAPDLTKKAIPLAQVGPGRYRGSFNVDQPGSFLLNVGYTRASEGGGEGIAHSVVTVPYAPEFRDLTDNTALLTRIAQATGGRVLPADATKADLFSRQGLTLPRTSQPLNQELFIAWLVLFLLDVATRRVAVNVRAMARRLAALFRPGRKAEEGQRTLQQLRMRRQEVRDEMAGKAAEGPKPSAATRYTGADAGEAEALPMADSAPVTPAAEKPKTPGAEAGADDGQMNRLLRAKKAARDRMADGSRDKDDRK